MARSGAAVRRSLHILLLALSSCTLETGGADCGADEREVCRSDGACRCGPPCAPGSACPATPEGPAACATLRDGAGVCVDIAWFTGLPRGRIPCGATTCAVATEQCVSWGEDRVGCAPRCTENGACDSGCCTPLSASTGEDAGSVCAPGAGFRCLDASTTTQRCDPPCGSGSLCARWDGAPRCLPRCGPSRECGESCCGAEDGLAVCLPDPRRCVSPPAVRPVCESLDACVEVTWAALGTRCAAGDSIEVHVRNGCDRPADVLICYERREGACACSMHRAIAPGASPEVPSWACGTTGRYVLSARGAGDPDACHGGC